MRTDAKIVIVGGGVIGLSVAYHLAALGERDVLLIERNTLTSGTSWHAAGIVGPLRATLSLTRLAAHALELFPALERETGHGTGFRRTGGYWLAQTPDRMVELARIAATAEMAGLEAQMLSADTLAELEPWLATGDLTGALRVEADGQASPVDLCMAYAKGARAGGVEIREGVGCAGVEVSGGTVRAVRLTTGETIRCDALVNCAGAWAAQLGAMAGVPVPLRAVEHMYVVTEPMDGLPAPVPVVRDLDAGTYIKGDGAKLVVGGFEPGPKLWAADGPDGARPFLELPEDWDQFEPFMTAGLARVPALATAGIQHFMNGPESFTPDSKPLVGESPCCRGFYVAAGFCSIGMMSSAGVGRAMAEWLVAGEAQTDLWEIDIARFDRAAAAPRFLAARMEEAVENQFAMHWPFKQMRTARGVRRTPLHDRLAVEGAVFGAPAGWERPLWFERTDGEAPVPDRFGAQGWWPAAAREAEATRDRVALYDLSPFTKIDVAGRDALALLQQLCGGDVDVAEGRAVYTQMLNAAGGIEADVTVTRLSEARFRVTSGAATRQRDLAWIERQRIALGLEATVHDATSAEAVIGVMGPRARTLLGALSDADLSADTFLFGTAQSIDVAMAEVRATRVSYVGELGWELSIPVEHAAHVHAALIEAGAALGLAHAGHLALDACRIEKGFAHWSHEIGPSDTPLEAGLGFAVSWDKLGGFLGRDALLRRRQAGASRRQLLFAVEGGPETLLLHEEPIRSAGRIVGLTTSGARGFRTGLDLAMGYVDCAPGTPKAELIDAPYEIDVAGERLPARALARPPYDPVGIRMRG
ncbi:MAG: FAD-dependent oxidoreductase [Pseudomonadota bacterium]